MSPPYMIYSAVAECDYSVLTNVRCFERRVSIVTVFWKGEEILRLRLWLRSDILAGYVQDELSKKANV